MLKYCQNPAFDGFIALPVGCDLDAVLSRFKKDYPLYELRYWLWRLLEAALTHDNFDSGEREDIIRLFSELECVMEVVYLGLVDKAPKEKYNVRG
jgi:hypothetical protein